MYQAFFFDFDGVLVDSVEVKTRAFASLFEPYGPDVVQKVIDHHRDNGAMTRVEKFRIYYREFLGLPLIDSELRSLCDRFAALVVDEVIAAPEIPGAEQFVKNHFSVVPCFIVSATPDEEIKLIVRRRGWTRYFRGIHGAPATKRDILNSILSRNAFSTDRCLYFGDAEGDLRAAEACGVNFLGIVPGPHAPLLKAAPGIPWVTDFSSINLSLSKD